MPRTAIISDIHSNLHALTAVIEDVQQQLCSDLVCLGDTVGYNAYPRECLEYIRSLNCPVVRGNHDEEVLKGEYLKMNPVAKQAMEWTRQQLDESHIQWLARLPFVRLVRSQFVMVHATLDTPKNWFYILNASDATSSFNHQALPLCFHGHTHMPRVFYKDGPQVTENTESMAQLSAQGEVIISLQAGVKYFMNVGAVGQSRDRDPRASYAIFDSDAQTVTFRRVAYDVQAAHDAVLAVGLPPYLAERLLIGQ